MDAPDRYGWWGEEPFPWLIGGAVLGLLLVPVLAWVGFELIDQNLESWVP